MLYHIKTYKAGESGYYKERTRGSVDVFHDSKRYIYHKPFNNLNGNPCISEFKREVLAAFGEYCIATISGEYPTYYITTRS